VYPADISRGRQTPFPVHRSDDPPLVTPADEVLEKAAAADKRVRRATFRYPTNENAMPASRNCEKYQGETFNNPAVAQVRTSD